MPKYPASIAAVAIVGKLNYPLLVHAFDSVHADVLKFHFVAHAACDYADNLTTPDNYLGLLTTLDNLHVYGHQTNTRVKLFLFVHATSESPTKDVEVKAAFELIHQAYLDLLANPFHDPDQVAMVQSPRLLHRLQSLVHPPSSSSSS